MKIMHRGNHRAIFLLFLMFIVSLAAVSSAYAQDELAGPLIDQNSAGAAPTPSTEITPGASDLTQPTKHEAPVDPLNSSLDATSLSPYVLEETQSTPVNELVLSVRDAAATSFGRMRSNFSITGLTVNPALFSGKQTAVIVSHAPIAAANPEEPLGADDVAAAGSTWRVGSSTEEKQTGPMQPLPGENGSEVVSSDTPAQGPQMAVSGEQAADDEDVNLGETVNATQQSPSKTATGVVAGVVAGVAVGVAAGQSDNASMGKDVQQPSSSLLWSLAAGVSPFRDLQSSSFLHPSILTAAPASGPVSIQQELRRRSAPSSAESTPEARLKRDTMDSFDREMRDRQRTKDRLSDRAPTRSLFRNPILEQMETNSEPQQ